MKEQGERDEPQSQTFTDRGWGGDTGTHKLSSTPGNVPTLDDMPQFEEFLHTNYPNIKLNTN